jgi:bis(5'-nucleosidyl)-tetraphosphatase
VSEPQWKQVKSCGVVLFARKPETRFLLMRHASRWDLPKGHVDPGETELECALREFEEETGIDREHVSIDPAFRYSEVYFPSEKRYGMKVEKTLVLFLGWIDEPREVALTEHMGAEWLEWNPPHVIQERTIDPVLSAIAHHLTSTDEVPRL